MINLCVLIRALYFLKHNCHNLASKASFFADHDFLGSSYEMSLKHYDSIVERIIGLSGPFNLIELQQKAVEKLKDIPIKYTNNEECFYYILEMNKFIINMIQDVCNKTSITEGSKQLLGGIADEIEVENYKLKQRLK